MSQLSQDKRRKALSRETLASGIEMAPCSGCQNAKISSRTRIRCVVGIRPGRCSECIRKGRKCDILSNRLEWERLRDLRVSLQDRLQKAEEREEELQQQWAKQRAEVMSLREQARLACARTDEEVAREIERVEEMDRIVEELMTGELQQEVLVDNQAMPLQWEPLDTYAGTWVHGAFRIDNTDTVDPSTEVLF